MNTVNIAEFKASLKARLAEHRHVALIEHTEDFIELIGMHLSARIKAHDANGHNECLFLDFWRLNWSGDVKYIADLDLRATNAKPSAARNVSAYYDKTNQVTERVEEFFFSTISKPPRYMQYINELVELARSETNQFLPSEFHIGKNIAFLFWATMTEIFYLTYEEEKTVTLSALGSFHRGLKVQRKARGGPEHKGYLQYTPILV